MDYECTIELEFELETAANSLLEANNAIQQGIERMQPILIAVALEIDKLCRQYEPVLEKFIEYYIPKFENFVQNYIPKIGYFAQQAIRWQVAQKINVAEMARQGWFPNGFTFFIERREGQCLDDFMISHIDDCLQELKKEIIEHCENRTHILEVAFKLHEEGNYIASIPLFLTQSDGICSEEFTYFFTKDAQTGKKAADEIIYQAEKGELAINFLSEILLEPFKVDLPITQGSSKASKAAKKKGPNRHGIMATSKKSDLKYFRFLIYQNRAIQPREIPVYWHHCAEKQRFRYNRT